MRLCDIIETYISGDWGNDEPTEDASCPVSCIRGADIVPIYNSDYNNIPLRYISEKSLRNRTEHFISSKKLEITFKASVACGRITMK